MWGRGTRRGLTAAVASLAAVITTIAAPAHVPDLAAPASPAAEGAVSASAPAAETSPGPTGSENSATSPHSADAPTTDRARTDRLIVRTEGHSPEELDAALTRLGATARRPLGQGWSEVTLAENTTASQAAAVAGGLEVEADLPLWKPATTPNDTNFSSQWALNQPSDDDIDAPEAWDVSTGSSSTTVAVIDTGVDISHPDLDSHIWTNPGESGGGKETNGVDDDGNGLVDDVHGWDWWNDDNTVYDSGDGDAHGTHVAGTIAAETNNGAGVAGVCWSCKIMPLKFLGPAGGYTSDAILAINYAVAEGAKVINASWGGSTNSSALKDAIDAAGAAGVLFVAAAGNDNANTDTSPHYPSSYTSTNLLSVAAIDSAGNRSSFSSYGPTSVDLGAPGSNILSTLPGGTYGYYSGTSMATPHVSGVAAVVAATGVTNVNTLRTRILDSAQPSNAMSGITTTGGVLNMRYAVTTPPASSSGRYHPVSPVRLLDTRNGTGMAGNAVHTVDGGESLALKVTGVGGIPSSGVGAVSLNVTLASSNAGSYLTVYPAGGVRPTASNLNFGPGQTIPNFVVVKVGTGGEILIFNAAGNAHVVVDVAGWYGDESNPEGAAYEPLTPARILDTRSGNGHSGRVGAQQTIDVQVTGRGGVPETGVSGVVMNVTAVASSVSSYITVFPTGVTRPTASNLNFVAGQNIPNMVMARIGTGGEVSFYNAAGTVDIVADVMGYFTDESSSTGPMFHPLTPYRALDTRYTTPPSPIGTAGIGVARDLTFAGVGGVPGSGAVAVVANVTVVTPQYAGFLTVWPSDEEMPTASVLNFGPGQVIPNLATAKLGADGAVSMATGGGNTHIIYDIAGYYE